MAAPSVTKTDINPFFVKMKEGAAATAAEPGIEPLSFAGGMGEAARDAGIALLDLSASAPPVDVLRDQGFLEGFGVDVKDENVIGDENDPGSSAMT